MRKFYLYMSNYTLPYYSEFSQILLNHEIVEWRANDFISAIFYEKQYIEPSEKQSIYRGLNILVKCNYLLRKRDKDNNNIFRYSESSNLKSFRNIEKIKKVKEALIKEQESLEDILAKRKTEKVFIENIVSKNPDLHDFFHKYDYLISKELNDLENKNNFINNIFQDIEVHQLEST